MCEPVEDFAENEGLSPQDATFPQGVLDSRSQPVEFDFPDKAQTHEGVFPGGDPQKSSTNNQDFEIEDQNFEIVSYSSKKRPWLSTYEARTSCGRLRNVDVPDEAAEESDAVLAVALYNFETFYNLEHGTANTWFLQTSSAGISGWASCVLEESCPSPASQEVKKAKAKEDIDDSPRIKEIKEKYVQDEALPQVTSAATNKSNETSTRRKTRGEEEEDQQLQVALLRSMGVNPGFDRENSSLSASTSSNDQFVIEDDGWSDDEWATKNNESNGRRRKKTTDSSPSPTLFEFEMRKNDAKTKESKEEDKNQTFNASRTEETLKKAEDVLSSAAAEKTYENIQSIEASASSLTSVELSSPYPNKTLVARGVGSVTNVEAQQGRDGALRVDSQESSDSGFVHVNDCSSSSSDEENSFVLVEQPAHRRVNRSSWQWQSLAQHVQETSFENPHRSAPYTCNGGSSGDEYDLCD